MGGLFAPMKAIVDGIVALSEYKPQWRLNKIVKGLIVNARTAGKLLVKYFLLWQDSTFENVDKATKAAGAMTGLFDAVRGIADAVAKIGAMPRLQPDAIAATVKTLDNFINKLVGVTGRIADKAAGIATVVAPQIVMAAGAIANFLRDVLAYFIDAKAQLDLIVRSAMPNETGVAAFVAALERTLAQMQRAETLAGQINALASRVNSMKPPAGIGPIAPGGGASSESVTRNYNLNITTTQPAVDVAGSFGLLEALA
jgi:hypothetical protein